MLREGQMRYVARGCVRACLRVTHAHSPTPTHTKSSLKQARLVSPLLVLLLLLATAREYRPAAGDPELMSCPRASQYSSCSSEPAAPCSKRRRPAPSANVTGANIEAQPPMQEQRGALLLPLAVVAPKRVCLTSSPGLWPSFAHASCALGLACLPECRACAST